MHCIVAIERIARDFETCLQNWIPNNNNKNNLTLARIKRKGVKEITVLHAFDLMYANR